MAHVGQKLALGTAGGFCCFLSLLQGFFRAFADGNVLVDTQRADDPAVYHEGNAVKFDVHQAPVFSHALRHQSDRSAAESPARDVASFREEVWVREESVGRSANDLGPGILKQLFKRGIA